MAHSLAVFLLLLSVCSLGCGARLLIRCCIWSYPALGLGRFRLGSDAYGMCLANTAWGALLFTCQVLQDQGDFTHGVVSGTKNVAIPSEKSFYYDDCSDAETLPDVVVAGVVESCGTGHPAQHVRFNNAKATRTFLGGQQSTP